jgi:hypothetical protein
VPKKGRRKKTKEKKKEKKKRRGGSKVQRICAQELCGVVQPAYQVHEGPASSGRGRQRNIWVGRLQDLLAKGTHGRHVRQRRQASCGKKLGCHREVRLRRRHACGSVSLARCTQAKTSEVACLRGGLASFFFSATEDLSVFPGQLLRAFFSTRPAVSDACHCCRAARPRCLPAAACLLLALLPWVVTALCCGGQQAFVMLGLLENQWDVRKQLGQLFGAAEAWRAGNPCEVHLRAWMGWLATS